MIMDNPINCKHEFINNVGLNLINCTNSLEHLLSYENMEEEITTSNYLHTLIWYHCERHQVLLNAHSVY